MNENVSLKAIATIAVLLSLMVSVAFSAIAAPAVPLLLDPRAIPKFVNQLNEPPPVYVPTVYTDPNTGKVTHLYTVNMTKFREQILPIGTPLVGNPDGMTWVWGYEGTAKDLAGNIIPVFHNSPGASFEATRGIPINVTWVNNIDTSHMFAVDPTLHWANPNNIPMMLMPPFPPYPPGFNGAPYVFPDGTVANMEGYNAQYPVPLIPHLHGGEVQSTSDGHPDAWFLYNGTRGPQYNTANTTAIPYPNAAVFHYPNMQPPTTLWYHDHALGITRLNVMSGLAGFYLLRDPNDQIAPLLPGGKYEMPLVIQDRIFDTSGELYFPSVGLNPMDHPYWNPEFFGNTIMVNGKVWPNMNVDQGQYRLRLLDGSNARFYTLTFWVKALNLRLPFVQIGSDGGYLKVSVPLTQLTIAPGERADILIDFSGLPAGTTIILANSAKAPFPSGTPADPQTVGQIMQFTVTASAGFKAQTLPAQLNPTLTGAFPTLPAPTKQRILTLWEVMGMAGPLEILLNGQKWAGKLSELPAVGTTEEWVIVNPTADTHPIHLHLTQFQLVSRQKINTKAYSADWVLLQQTTGGLGAGAVPPWPLDYVPLELAIGPYLKGKPTPAPLNEQGWKDTIQVNPGEVTIIRVRFAPIDGSASYPFDPTQGPGYVWHCHILDHEDNEMMRPYKVMP